MAEDKTIGYTKEEYYKISSKNGLPKRCPILRKCCRAVLTRYNIGHDYGGSDMTFDEFLHSQGQSWDLAKMIKEIEIPSWKYAHDVLTSVENVCPEVTLFEPEYMPNKFIQSAYGSGSYYKESRRFEAEPKHFSECAEFSEYSFHNMKNGKGRKRSPFSNTLKFEIFERDKFRCYYCKKHKEELPPGVHLTIDHKIPYVDGGDDSFSNLVTACSECNSGKSHKAINDL